MSFYIRRMYHEEKIGPFGTETEARDYIEHKIKQESYWDYDSPIIFKEFK